MNYKLINEINTEQFNLVEQVLHNRGIIKQQEYLYPTENNVFNPLLLDNIHEGAIMLMKHIYANDKIFIIVDEDQDGYTSAALLLNYLHAIFPYYTEHNIVYKTHDQKAHGLVLADVPKDTKLIIIPDAGSNQLAEHAAAVAQGQDVLILDHHHVADLPPNACLINNQSCDYPNKGLSGVGIVYKFCSYLDTLLSGEQGKVADRFLDLVAIGCVADMVSLRDLETRYFLERGMAIINNPFIKGMMEKNDYQIKGKLTPHKISFYIAPLVNAVARVGTPEERRILFESMLDFCAYDEIPSTKRGCKGQKETKVEQACRNCSNVRNRQNKERDISLEKATSLIEKNNLLENPMLIIQYEDGRVNENITGLIANQIANQYYRPTLILNKRIDEEENILWQGSGRNINGTSFEDLQKFLLDSNLVEYAAGHANAFGIGVKDINLQALKDYAKANLNLEDFLPLYRVDDVRRLEDYNRDEILAIGDLEEIWGQDVEKPYIVVTNVKVNSSNTQLLKGTTIKITPANRQDGLTLIMFGSDEQTFQLFQSEYGVVTLDVVGRCARNDWNDAPQIIIEDFEIVGRQDYYF